MMSTLSLYTYVASKNTIDLATAFTVLIFFDKLSQPMSQVPWLINNTLELLVSMKRVQEFLDQEELAIENFVKNDSENKSSEYSI
jgi:ABC-type multidrug transport system fused ATPase/permease subunit